MSKEAVENKPVVWKESAAFWALLVASGALAGLIFYDAIDRLVLRWLGSEEYGYGFLIPLITGFLIWQKKDELEKIRFDGSWTGFCIAFFGVIIFFLGYFSTIYIVTQYGLVVVVLGVAYSIVGFEGIKKIWVPLIFLLFMIPLPNFLYKELSAELQLISSSLGVAVIRLFGISVYLEGNVIDLGSYKLQVVEACSGLRYLFPLVTLAFIATYFYKVAFWKRALVFFSSIPITVFMNSFRIGAIGVLVEYGGPGQAEGFLHDFEGWIIFMACLAILILEMWLLTRIGKDKKPLMEAFGLELPEQTPENAETKMRSMSKPFLATVVVLMVTAIVALMLDSREEVIQKRADFNNFPVNIETWQGKSGFIDRIYLDVLKLDDYIISDYSNGEGERVNFYAAYYASQRSGESAHSPRSCIPGGGWLIKDLSQINITAAEINGGPLKVNRLIIRKGDFVQLVYYWFQQRGRNITGEYAVKWYLFWDALTKNRTDGALIRLTTFVPPGKDIREADRVLKKFTGDVVPVLNKYIPD